MKESDVVYENDTAWVLKNKASYAVMVVGPTHSTSDSHYALDENGLSIAIARADYIHRVHGK